MDDLTAIASEASFYGVTVRAEFPGHTFTAPLDVMQANVSYLQSIRRPQPSDPLWIQYSPDKYHSWTDDPANFAQMIQDTISLNPF
jgi:hypothetical protein